MTVKDRIIEYLNNKGISITRAEVELGWSKGALLKANSISSDRLKEFILRFKDISLEWLIAGEGEMLKSLKEESFNFTSGNNIKGDGNITGNKVLSGNINGNGNNVGIHHADCQKELMRAQVEIEYLKKDIKNLKEQQKTETNNLKEQLKQAITDKEKALAMLDKALSK